MNKKKVIITILIFILIIVGIVTKVMQKLNNNETVENTPVQDAPNYGDEIGSYKQIKITETYSSNEVVKGLENVIWNMAYIEQGNDKMTVTIYLSNSSETESVPEKELVIKIKDEDGKNKYYQDVHMDSIEANYGYTIVTAEFNIEKIEIIKNIEVSVKK